MASTVAVAALLATLPASAAAAIATGGAPTPVGRPPGAAERDRHTVHRRAQRRHAEPRIGEGRAPGVLLLRRPQPEPALRNRKHTAPERPPHRRRRRRVGGSGAQLLPQRRRTAPYGRHPLGRRHRNQTAGAERPLQLPGRLPGRPAGRPPRDQLERTAQPQLRLLRLRLPDPRQARLRRRGRPLRRRPRRPYPPGPGRDGRLRAAGRRRAGRAGPVLDLGRPRPATTSSSTARAPPTTPPTCTSPNPRR